MRSWSVFRRWLGVSALSGAASLAAIAGCGGTDATIIGDDGGSEVGASSSSSSSSGGNTGSSSSGAGSSSSGASSSSGSSGGAKDSGADSKPGADASGDSTTGGDSTVGGDAAKEADATVSDSTTGGDSTMGGDAPVDSSGNGDSSMPDAEAGGGDDSSSGADASDGSASCAPENGPCSNDGTAGLCRSGSCLPCVDSVDDAACTAAYGGASASYLCLAGICTPGDCRTDADCASNPNGGLCGVSTPNACGKCVNDQQCAGSTGGSVCNTGTGQCVVGTCPAEAGISLGGAPAACPINAADICCTTMCQPAPGTNACCDGPNAAAYCATKLGDPQAACLNNLCTVCPQATGNNYLVDPVNGNDQTGTGDDTTTGCAFKTITRALQVIGPSPVLATTITVAGPSTVGAGETFPIPLPTNVVLTTTGNGVVEVDVPVGKAGFTFSQVGSGINGATTMANGGTVAGLSIVGHASGGVDSGATGATYGVVVGTGTGVTTMTGPILQNAAISGFVDDGILVENAGVLQLGTGVSSTANGTPSARKAGLHVTGTGQALIRVASGDMPAHFDQNTNHGILVDTNGSIAVAGVVTGGVSGTGTVTTNNNYAAGVWIEQTPGSPPLNSIDGLVSFANTNGAGMRIVAGSNVQLRNSALVGNQGNGVIVSAGAAAAASNDISMIDLGAGMDAGGTFGRNTLQEPLGSGNNGGAGICLEVKVNSGTLRAEGNIFGAVDCAVGGGALKLNSGACGNAACTGGVCDLGVVTTTGNDFDVSVCAP